MTESIVIPDDLRYDAHHQWARWEDGLWRCGITAYQAEMAGDFVAIGLPAVGARVSAGEELGSAESGKWATSLFAPVDGRVIEVNAALREDPSLVNRSPYDDGWVFVLRPEGDLVGLDAASYLDVIRAEEAAEAPRVRERTRETRR
jgi:glycine cleavage system H protein